MKTVLAGLFSLVLVSAMPLVAQSRFEGVELGAQHLRGSVHVVRDSEGRSGGNIGVSAGSDGVLIVDEKFAELADDIVAVLDGISETALRYVINTHYHGDHVGANAFFARRAVIVAHDNVRRRLANDPDTAPAALPVVTFEHGVKVHINGEVVQVRHLSAGHTDGDSIVYFEKANVLHAGDLFFVGRFPYIDLKAGGTVAGYMAAIRYVLDYFPDDVIIIPGHGEVSDKAGYRRVLEMMEESVAVVKEGRAAGLSEEEIVARGAPPRWQDWGGGFISEERWLRTLYRGL